MVTTDPDPASRASLRNRLQTLRQQRFVGREDDLALFREALESVDPSFAVLYVHGPGGVGKTTLLDAFARQALQQGCAVARVDGRAVEASPEGFARALDLHPDITGGARLVVMIDTYEHLSSLDAWLRDTFLPGLPDDTLVVIAGRNPPSAAWRLDLGWGALFRVLPLRNLQADDAMRYLALRQIPEDARESILTYTHGHPLALSLVADVAAQGKGNVPGSWSDDPDVLRVLLERFVEGVPDTLHRQALQVCAHVRVTDEAMLAEVLQVDDPQPLFAWLRDLSFIEQGRDGLFPHDLARDVLEADLRWRNTVEFRELHLRTRRHIVRRLQEAPGREKHLASFDLLYLHRNNPVMKPFHHWNTFGSAYAESAGSTDAGAIVELVKHHEGAVSAAIAEQWLARQPEAFTVFRSGARAMLGFGAILRFETPLAGDVGFDPAVAAAVRYAEQRGPMRPGDVLLYHRFSIGRDTYQAESISLDMLVMISIVAWLSTPRLAWTFQAFADPGYWEPMMSYINTRRAPEADFTAGDRSFGVFAHDWRGEPPVVWLELMAEREIDIAMTVEDVRTAEAAPVLVLDENEFRDAVRRALRDLHNPVALASGPLGRSRLMAGSATMEERGRALQAILQAAIASLKGHPKDERFYRALHRTFVAPAATQELAAEALGLPFSTYRSHLTAGIQRVADDLRQRELFDPS